MKHPWINYKIFTIVLIIAGILLSSLSLALIPISPVEAQGVTTPPVANLSKMGSSSNPAIVVDSQGSSHVFWYDEFAGNKYTYSVDGVEWTEPIDIDVPFGEYSPRLISGPDDTIQAFWIGRNASLLTSWAKNYMDGSIGTWTAERLLSRAVLSYDVATDDNGFMHLVYLLSGEESDGQAGIYYRKSVKGGLDWQSTTPLIYTSPYFRGLEVDQSSVGVAVSPGASPNTVMLTWDERPLQKVFLSRSIDSGETWGEIVEVDRPNAQTGFAMPMQLDVSFWGSQAFLVWSKGGGQDNCSHRYQISTDNGETWAIPGTILDDTTNCPTSSMMLTGRSDMLVWEAIINNQVYLISWDGAQWSEPQVQSGLASFEDPETSQLLTLGCQQFVYLPSTNSLGVVGCDQEGRGDIWFLTFPFGDINTWFLPLTEWRQPLSISEVPDEIGSLQLLADSQAKFHALWVQTRNQSNADSVDASSLQQKIIYYAGPAGEAWSPALEVLKSPFGNVGEMHAAINQSGQLMVVWWGTETKELFFSEAQAERASIPGEWSEVYSLPVPSGVCSSPFISVDDEGRVFVVYAVPLNEGRGIYLVRSVDNGKTWGDPVQIFNAQAASWEKVDEPILAMATDGRLHVVWQQELAIGDEYGQALYYSYSDDQGDTWGAAELVVEGIITWGKVLEPANGRLYRVWQDEANDQPSIASQISYDGGNTWNQTYSVSTTGEALSRADLQSDRFGRMHLLQISSDQSNRLVMRHWISNEESWTAGINLDLTRYQVTSVGTLAGAVSSKGEIAALLKVIQPSIPNEQMVPVFLDFTSRILEDELSEPIQTVEPLSATLTPVATEGLETAVVPTVAFTTTPTVNLQVLDETPVEPPANTWSGLIIAIIISTLIVGLVFGFSIVRTRKLVRKSRKNPY